ncbi:cytochrome c biogenesis protein CcdA [Actinoplanes campanulatus]|uniref:cytochrome-c oxidase n=1 Tax=Actinoplanes campanulatus TaxID=113559 RepID=A0A7W5APA5_9ACTN|nr:cytochrome c oxidase subunit 4 [Actinoplanes campanulatus]MBB3099948.1 cytochrome c biogenesis protein CcdA [Actinoplanes campanulatus]GGN29834.1 putative cytochrome c oxidase polypeptide 4 [Actinoplanes campanulatus]GID42187.1 putative cytochrome c oxidase polypeptide 4 [Actinoplanes campanulatus]
MRTEYKIFAAVAVFLFGAAAVYGLYTLNTGNASGTADGYEGGTEWVGVVALILSGLLCSMCAGFFWFVARRIDLRPEDREDGEIAEGAGEVGFFSPGSYWPFGIALAAAVAGIGLVFWMWWLLAFGLVCVIFASCGLLFEYYSGTRHPEAHL